MNETPDTQSLPSTHAETPQEPVKAPPLPYTFKANLKEYRRRMSIVNIIAALIISSFFFIKFGWLVGILSVVGLALLIVGILYILSTRAITLKPDGIDYRNGFGKIRSIPYEQLEGVKVFINYVEANFGASPRVVLGVKSASPLSLLSLYWPIEDIDKLLAVLRDKNIPTEYYDQPVNYTMIAKQFPTYATYIERYPGRIAIIISAIIIVGAVAIALAVTFLD